MSQHTQQPQQDRQGQPGSDQPNPDSTNAKRAAPYDEPPLSQRARESYGATEDEVSRNNATIAPTFSDTEPGAGPNYGAAGDPYAPNWGGLADLTTLGPEEVRPPEQRLVRDGGFETHYDEQDGMPS